MSAIKFKILDYIESTGNSQLIHTGVLMQNLTKIEITLQATRTNVLQGITGRYTSSNSTIQIIMNNSSGKLTAKWGANSFSVNYDKNIHKIEFSKTRCVIDDVVLGTYDGITPYDNDDLIIFARRTDNSGSGIKNNSYIKVYGCKIYYDDVLLRDFIPALDNNNVPCMYDKVTEMFYYTESQTPFTAGNIIGTYTNLIYDRTEEDVEYAKNNQDSSDNLKGAYNYTDLNRIEEWTSDIGSLLNSYGYHVSITTKTDWLETDFPTKAQMKRIRDNVSTLKNAFIAYTNVPENLEKMTYTKANQIEKVLEEIYLLIGNMETSFWYSGEINSGEV